MFTVVPPVNMVDIINILKSGSHLIVMSRKVSALLFTVLLDVAVLIVLNEFLC